MFEKLFLLVKNNAGKAVIENPEIPEKYREAVINEASSSIIEVLKGQMESGKLPLEDLIVRYEEGMNLVKVCQERLASAEQKIEIIARNSAGKTFVKNFEPTQETTVQTESAEPSENKNDEVRLF